MLVQLLSDVAFAMGATVRDWTDGDERGFDLVYVTKDGRIVELSVIREHILFDGVREYRDNSVEMWRCDSNRQPRRFVGRRDAIKAIVRLLSQ